MKEKSYIANILLAAETGILSLAGLMIKAFVPGAVLPEFGIPTVILLSVIPLTAEYYAEASRRKNYFFSVILAGVSLSVIPWCAGVLTEISLWAAFLIACAAYGIVSLLYEAMTGRMDEDGNKKAAPVINAMLLWAAGLCTMGLL